MSIEGNELIIKKASNLAKQKKNEMALKEISKLSEPSLTSSELRQVALVYSNCRDPAGCERCWLEIIRRGEERVGDLYMLGTSQVELAKYDCAIENYEKEIALAVGGENKYFLICSVIQVSSLLMIKNNPSKIESLLSLIKDDDGDYIVGVGYKTKQQILREIESKRE